MKKGTKKTEGKGPPAAGKCGSGTGTGRQTVRPSSAPALLFALQPARYQGEKDGEKQKY